LPNTDVEEFLKSKGMPEEGQVKIHRNKKNTNCDILEINNETAKAIIANLHEKIFFNKKVYCRGLLKIDTPEKIPVQEISKATEDKSASNKSGSSPTLRTPGTDVPGLPEKDKLQALKKQKRSERKKKNDAAKIDKAIVKGVENSDSIHDQFQFRLVEDTESESDSGESVGLGWRKSPLDSANESSDDKVKNLLEKHNFSSRSAKKIQKEHQWMMTTQAFKRVMTSPNEGPDRRLRARSICN
jgi:hypothetical protein